MAIPAGFEPATVRLEGGCSIQLSYGTILELATYNMSSQRTLNTIAKPC